MNQAHQSVTSGQSQGNHSQLGAEDIRNEVESQKSHEQDSEGPLKFDNDSKKHLSYTKRQPHTTTHAAVVSFQKDSSGNNSVEKKRKIFNFAERRKSLKKELEIEVEGGMFSSGVQTPFNMPLTSNSFNQIDKDINESEIRMKRQQHWKKVSIVQEEEVDRYEAQSTMYESKFVQTEEEEQVEEERDLNPYFGETFPCIIF